MISLDEYFQKIEQFRGEKLSQSERKLLSSAFRLGKEFHEGQKRASGEDYFGGHCVPVSLNVASLHMDSSMIAAGLLHDTLEDTALTKEELEKTCGKDIAEMVDAVSKLSKVRFQGNERHVESLRKFFVAIAKDARVVTLKLCDRWHNLETLLYLPEEKRQRIARESILIHAQLASRLGIGKLASILKDLAFPFAYPEEYNKTREILEDAMNLASKVIEKMYRDLLVVTTESLGYTPGVDKRIKGVYSSYKKLVRKNWDIDQLSDLVALRVIVETQEECYKMLGIIHSKWQPVPGRLKDYIALPKPNGYRSLHTTVMSGSGLSVEIQIRTAEMHDFDEYGIASHHTYKSRQLGEVRESFAWVDQLGSLKDQKLSPDEYIHILHSDFFEDRIFALTPLGDVIDLPAGATALDFAYAVHSDIGDSAQGARINGKFCALSTPIPSESVVEVIVSTRNKPSEKWLEWAHTAGARAKIKKRLTTRRRSAAASPLHNR